MPRLTRTDDVEPLARAVLDPERRTPIVALSTQPGQRDPAAEPDTVRRIVGPDVPIVLVVHGPVSRGSRPDGVVELAGVCRHDESPVL